MMIQRCSPPSWTTRSFVTRLLETGTNPKDVQMMAGHASILTTMKYYAGVSARSQAAAVARIATNSCHHLATEANIG